MNLSSRCRICLIDNVQMHSVVGSKLHEIYETLTEIPFEINDGRPLQVCYICRERLLNCYKLQANCWKSEELFNQILTNNNLTSTPFQEIKTLKMSEPIIHASIVPMEQTNLCNNTNIDVSDLNMNPLETLVQVQIKEEPFEDVDDMPLEGDTETQRFGIEVKQEKPPELEHVTVRPSEDRSDNTEVNYLDMPIKEETQSKINHIIIEVDSVQPIIPVSEKPNVQEENSDINISSKLGTVIRFQQNETENIMTQSIGQFFIEQNKFGISNTIDLPAGTEFFKCDICHRCFNHKNNFNDHIRIHTGEKPYKCSICGKAFRQKQHLFTHTRIHTDEKPYKCNVCEKAFAQRNSLKVHKCIKMVDRIYISGKLEREFRFQPNKATSGRKDQESVGTSSKTDIPIRTEIYKCGMCHKNFDHKNNYNDHIRIHTGEKPHKCSFCEKGFRQKQHLIAHTRTHTGEKPYKCDVCEKSFAQRNTLKAHQGIHTDNKPHVCEICGKGYIEKHNLVNHLRTHNNEKPFQCDHCEKKFSYRKLLIAHIRSQHSEKAFKCNVCHKGFHAKNNLNAHMRTHTGEKPYQCSGCEKSFRQKQHLNAHFRIHTGEKPYKCDVCEKYFKRRSELKTHTRRHTGEKPHKCDVCGKCYSFKRNLHNHIRIHKNE